MRSPSHVPTALLLAVLLVPPLGSVAGQESDGSAEASGEGRPWAVSLELAGGIDALYGGWRRVLPGVHAGVELQTALAERTVEVDRLDRPGEVNASSDRDHLQIGVGPSVRWRIRPEARLSPVVRVHAGYLRSRSTVRDDTGEFERTADGAVVRGSLGVDSRVSGHLHVVLSLTGRWSMLEGDVLFHADETSRTTELDLLRPAAALRIRF